MKTSLFLCVSAAVALSVPLHAQNCGSGTNAAHPIVGGNIFAGNMFDVTIGADAVTIECLDINTSAPVGNAVTVDVYYCPTTCIGNDQNQLGNWVLIGTGTGVSSGANVATLMDLTGNGVVLDANTSYGFYVDYSVNYLALNGSLYYTNGVWGATTYNGDDMDINCYYGKGTPAFTGSTFGSLASGATREWNGVLYTEFAGPTGPSIAVSAGAPGGSMTFDFAGYTASSPIAVLYGPAGSFTAPGGPCAGTTVDLQPINISNPILLFADANGDAVLTQNVPGAGAGLTVQAADVATCAPSNAIVL